MRFIENVPKEQYEEFVQNHDKSHFLQSYSWGQFAKQEKNLIPHYVGLEDNNGSLVATALLLQKKLPFHYCYFYCPRGFLIDYHNKKRLKTFTDNLKKFAQKNKALFVKIDPDIKLHDLDIDGNILNHNESNAWLVDYLKTIGYKHLGFNKNFERNQPRYTFRLDLSPTIEDITNAFHPTTKKIINKNNPYHLKLIKNDAKTIKDFYKTMQETSERENIVNHTCEYYKKYYELLHQYNMSDLYVVKADITLLKKTYQEKITQLEEKIESMKNANKKQELINQLNKLENEYSTIKNIKNKELTLSAILTAKYGNKVWTLYGGNSTLLRKLNANYFIYYEIIKDAKKENYEIIDFFGTTGNPDPENPVYGIHLFKKRLGGEYTEFIGEFDLVLNKFMYFVFTKLVPCYRNIVKKMAKRKNQKSKS